MASFRRVLEILVLVPAPPQRLFDAEQLSARDEGT